MPLRRDDAVVFLSPLFSSFPHYYIWGWIFVNFCLRKRLWAICPADRHCLPAYSFLHFSLSASSVPVLCIPLAFALSVADVNRCHYYFQFVLNGHAAVRFYFSFANLGQPVSCKDHYRVFLHKVSTRFPHFLLHGKPKQNVVFQNFPRNSLHLGTFHCCLYLARKNYKSAPAQNQSLTIKNLKIMTASVLTSAYKSSKKRSTKRFYSVVINDFDGDSYEYEVEADSKEEAGRKAECIAHNQYIQISYIEVY